MTPYDVIVFAIRDYRADLWADADDLADAILNALDEHTFIIKGAVPK